MSCDLNTGYTELLALLPHDHWAATASDPQLSQNLMHAQTYIPCKLQDQCINLVLF